MCRAAFAACSLFLKIGCACMTLRTVIQTLADTASVLELRADFAQGMVTAFIRVEGRPLGVIANNPTYLAGAITSAGANKAARFMQLCNAHSIPLLFLCDTPGIMVGAWRRKRRRWSVTAARMFVTGASLRVPFFTIVLRKCYGLGAQAMAGGSLKAPLFTVSWPTGEFGGMGLEGAGQARLPEGVGRGWKIRRNGRLCTRRWWRSCTNRGRHSISRPTLSWMM